jgi:hypothetical protein
VSFVIQGFRPTLMKIGLDLVVNLLKQVRVHLRPNSRSKKRANTQ